MDFEDSRENDLIMPVNSGIKSQMFLKCVINCENSCWFPLSLTSSRLSKIAIYYSHKRITNLIKDDDTILVLTDNYLKIHLRVINLK